jgi:hypothetical protein
MRYKEDALFVSAVADPTMESGEDARGGVSFPKIPPHPVAVPLVSAGPAWRVLAAIPWRDPVVVSRRAAPLPRGENCHGLASLVINDRSCGGSPLGAYSPTNERS